MGFCCAMGSSRTVHSSAPVAEAKFGDPITSFHSVEGRDLYVGTTCGRIALFDMRMAAAVFNATPPDEQGPDAPSKHYEMSTICEMNDIDAWSTCGVRALQLVEGDMIAVIGEKGMKRWPAADHEPLRCKEAPCLRAIPFPGRQRTGGQGHSLSSGSSCMVLQQGCPAYVYDAASYSYGSCCKLVLPWSSTPLHMGASSVIFREMAHNFAAGTDDVVDAGGWGLGRGWDFTLWGCGYSDWGSAVVQNQPR
jgi:hypothetical protein